MRSSAAALEAATLCERCDEDADGCACCDETSDETSDVLIWKSTLVCGRTARQGAGSPWARMVGRSRAAPLALSHHPLIDCHQHCQVDDAEGLDTLHRINVALGVSHAVLLALRHPGGDAKDVRRRNRWVLDASRRYGGAHFIPFVTIIEDDPGAAAMFESAIEHGARGLKLIGWSGTFIKQYDYDLRSSVMKSVFRLAEARRVPILAHVWLGCQHVPHRDYVADLDAIMSEHPELRLILAHWGLGFSAMTLPRLSDLLSRHTNLYLDTSLYGGGRAKWLGRASEHSSALRLLVHEHPGQICFGSDVFGQRFMGAQYHEDALRTSYAMVAADEVRARPGEFPMDPQKFDAEGGWGPTTFDARAMRGLGLGGANPELLGKISAGNAASLLGVRGGDGEQLRTSSEMRGAPV